LLYEALNGLIDTTVSWELFKDRKISLVRLSGFELLYEGLNGLIAPKVSWESFKDRKVSL
jgi:hypothetical protein